MDSDLRPFFTMAILFGFGGGVFEVVVVVEEAVVGSSLVILCQISWVAMDEICD